MTKINILLKNLSLLLFASMSLFAEQNLKATTKEQDTTFISLPEGTVEGWLSNGLHYLILENSVPESRIEFRLVMRVGSLQEADNQKGAAHFLEHVAFGGTKHYPKRSLVEYLESLGMKYGRDINAVTGFDRTIYMFGVPTDKNKEETIDKSLLILRDWLDGMALDTDKVEREKGIILEELRGYDLGDDFYDLKIGQGRFKDRMPLGEIDDIKSMTPKTLNEYYTTWYRPSLATLVIVGDISPAEIEVKIKEKFSSLRKGEDTSLISYPLVYDKGLHIYNVRDSLLSKTTLELIIPHPCIIEKTINDAVMKQQVKMLIYALNKRMRARRIDATTDNHWYLSDKDHFVISVKGVNREELFENVSKAVNELYYIASDGWCDEELFEVKRNYIENLNLGDNASRLSSDLCDNFADYIISGDKYVVDISEKDKVKELLMHTSSQDVQKILNEILKQKEKVLLAACHSHNDIGNQISKDDIEKVWLLAKIKVPETYTFTPNKIKETGETETPDCLAITRPFDERNIKKRVKYKSLNIEEIVLSNGIRLILKPTEGEDVIMTSFARGGLSCLSVEDYPLLEGVAGYMDMGGIDKVDSEILEEYLYENNISLATTMENDWHGFMGSSSSERLEEFFNLMREKIFSPELNYSVFEDIKSDLMKEHGKETILAKMLNRSPDRLLMARMTELMGLGAIHPTRDLSKDEIQQLNLDSIASFYKKLYTNISQTTFVLVGRFESDDAIRKFVSVFGHIPTNCIEIEQIAFANKLPTKQITEQFTNDNETQTVFDYVYFGHYEPSLRNTLILKLMRDAISNRVLSILREQESLVYSPYVSLSYKGVPNRSFYLDINASAENGNMTKIHALIQKILKDLQANQISDIELETLKRSFLITKREILNDQASSAWRTTIVDLLKNGESLDDFNRYEDILDSITTSSLKDAFKQYINLDTYLLLYLNNNQK